MSKLDDTFCSIIKSSTYDLNDDQNVIESSSMDFKFVSICIGKYLKTMRISRVGILAIFMSINSVSLYAVEVKNNSQVHVSSVIPSSDIMIKGEHAKKINLVTDPFAIEPPQATKLNQAQYNTRMQYYTDQVKASKAILDVENSSADAKQQKQALCTRIQAYQNITKWSQVNIQLESANMMIWVADQFLQRQKESMEQSGMTLDQLCVNTGSDQLK